MPAFVAINVEPEDNVEDEADVTRRIEVDDALKLYQTALKLHAQGPRSFPEAEKAYDDLFESEIFKYPEARTEYERTERQPDPLAPGPLFTPGLDALLLDDNSSGSSLPQAYYLSYKNHGQFLVDRVRHKARTASKNAEPPVFQEPQVLDDSRKALDDFDAALDRDPSEADLWRRAARIAAFLKSARIERYCLEAAIELDDDPAVVEVEPPSLAEGFAGEQLRTQLQRLADDVSLSHPAMAPFLKKQMAASLKRYLDPFPWLPYPTSNINALVKVPLSPPQSEDGKDGTPRLEISFTKPSWADLGMALVQSILENGLSGRAISVDAPDMPDDHEIMQIEIDQQLSGFHEIIPVDADGESNQAIKAEEGDAADKVKVRGTPEKDADTQTDGADQETHKDADKEHSTSQPRKRSQSAAGLGDADEDNADTKRSKRIRRRETLAEETQDPSITFAHQLEPYHEADQSLFKMTKSLLETLGVHDIPALDETIEVCGLTEDRIPKLQNRPARELYDSLLAFKDDRAKILLSKKDTPVLGLDAFLEHTKGNQQHTPESEILDEMRGLRDFVCMVNNGWYTIHDVVYEWIVFMSRSYTTLKWTDAMKLAVVQIMSKFDEPIYQRVCHELQRWEQKQKDMDPDAEQSSPGFPCGLHSLVQMMFELYLDIYERITNPSSAVELSVRMETKARLDQWMDLASGLVRSVSQYEGTKETACLAQRFLWSCVFFTTVSENVSRDHTLACWESLRQSLDEEQDTVQIFLPNNVVMPEVSHKAADREISKLTTMDFFLSLFQEELKDPLIVIDKLEPVLNPNSVNVSAPKEPDTEATAPEMPISECAGTELRDMWKFLGGSSTDLRLFLWTRLADAYKEIDYTTKVFSCYLRSIEMISADLEGEVYLTTPQGPTRRKLLMHLLKTLDETMIQALHLAVNDSNAFEIIDESHLRSTTAALVRISCMLHVAALHEDEIRIGMTLSASNSQTFHSFINKLREMQARTWTLQYTMIKAGLRAAAVANAETSAAAADSTAEETSEADRSAAAEPSMEATAKTESTSSSASPTPDLVLQNQLAEYIGAIHETIGLRKFCKASNKIFLRLARSELLKMRGIENWEHYLGQVLYDLHGLKLSVSASEVEEHACPAEKLERKNALALVDKVTSLANGVPMKELLKSDLKNTIEQMQQAIGQTKSTTQMIHNLRYFTEYLKRPIHPLRLYEAWKGIVELDTVQATTPDTVLARNGWFFLLGMIALTKFKGVDLNRRQTPGATDDLRIGAQYLRLQLQLTPSRWDVWFRLAECYDYDLDESVLWSAEKMNKDRAELVKLQRSAIHCYTLALSYWQSEPGELSSSDYEALHNMYHNFAMRLYASTREPFAMEAFHHNEYERWFIAPDSLSTYTGKQHGEMTDYMVWRYAAGLFRRAMIGRSKDWKSAHMYSKCIWKMYEKPAEELSSKERASQPTVDDVVRALEKSIESVSLLPKSRHGDPVLEPHYKILSIVDKLVLRGDMQLQAAADLLQRQPYAIQKGETISITSNEEWEDFVVHSLQHLRDKDKSNWQHRMTVRHAHILFGDVDLKEHAAPEALVNGQANGSHATAGTNGVSKEDGKEPVLNGEKNDTTNGVSLIGLDGVSDDREPGQAEVPKDDIQAKEVEKENIVESANESETVRAEAEADSKDDKMDIDTAPVGGDGKAEKNTTAANEKSTEADKHDEMDKSKDEEKEKPDAENKEDKKEADKESDNEKKASKENDKEGDKEKEKEDVGMDIDATEDKEPEAKDAEEEKRLERAKSAFNVLRESMFTKTMVMNVWKCDAERPGRHHVYTEQYVRFVTRLLVVIGDRVNLEMLLRRIRKKGADFYHFNDLWQTCVVSYLRLLRKYYKVPLSVDDSFKAVSPEEFEILTDRITEWVGQPEVEHPALSAMREAIEIKKLNGNLMKAGPIDDLISDCYSVIFSKVSRTLPGEDPAKIIEERHRLLQEEADKKAAAEAEAASSTANIILTFNLLSEQKNGINNADKDGVNGVSRAGSDAGGGSLSHLSAEKMERQGSGMSTGDHPVRRGRPPGVRRPDILRKAEQAIVRFSEMAAKQAEANGGGSAAGGSGHGGHAAAASGPSGRSISRRSTRLGSASSKPDGHANGTAGGHADGNHKDGDGSSADSDGHVPRTRSTRSKSRRLSVSQDAADTEMKDADAEEGEGEEDEEHEDHGENEDGEEADEVEAEAADAGEAEAEGDEADAEVEPELEAGEEEEVDAGVAEDGQDGVTKAEAKDEEATAERDDGDKGELGHKSGVASEASSPPGSVHDSADDESELSDVPPDYEDNAPESMLFPNLGRSEEPEDEEDGADEEDEAEEDEEEEEEEEDGDDEEEEEEEGKDGEDVEMEDVETASSPAHA